ncbi:MAG: hypothetical protein LBQ47_03875 [Endomicrobium sp.]|jgi:hypothetical protein|nr:hypothetical protein [Endomicrobium sp.]
MLRQEMITLKTGEYPVKTLDKDGNEKTENVFTDFKRDNGKIFRFTEFSAIKLEKWSIKCGIISQKIADKAEAAEMKAIENNHSATLAYLPFAVGNEKSFFEFLDCFNELNNHPRRAF